MNYDPALPPDPSNVDDPRNLYPNYPSPGGRGGGLPIPGAGGIILLAIVYLILLLSFAAALSAIVSAPALKFFSKFFDWKDPLGWGHSFTAGFFGFFAYFLVAVFQIEVGGRDMYDTVGHPLTLPWFVHNFEVYTLPILACAGVIWYRLKGEFRSFAGVRGYLRALFVSIACLWISQSMITASARRLAGANETQQSLIEGFLSLTVVALIFAIIGGIAAALPIFIGTRGAPPRGAKKPGLLRIYATAVLVLLTWFFGSFVFELCFNTLDQAYFYLKDPEVRAQATVTPFEYLLPFALAFLVLQMAVAGLAGGVVVRRHKPFFDGRAGWIRASVLALVGIILTIAPFVVLLTAMWASGEFKPLFQSF